MIVEQFEVLNELGFHARVASRIVRELRKFESNVIVKKEGKDFNLKSVLGVMTVNAKKGDVVTIEFRKRRSCGGGSGQGFVLKQIW